MHDNSLQIMKRLFKEHAPHGAWSECYDVGSYDVNGTYRPIAEGHLWNYSGIDISPGPNVDVVLPEHSAARWSDYLPPVNLVISGQCMEHTRWPWRWIEQVRELMSDGGKLFLIVPASWEQHRFPIDCWRVLPDGMRALADWARLELIDCGLEKGEHHTDHGEDCWAVMRRVDGMKRGDE